MRDGLQMQVIEPQHHLPHDIDSLSLRETFQFLKTFEQLSALHNLWNYIIIVFIFQQINNSDDFRMTFAPQDAELIF